MIGWGDVYKVVEAMVPLYVALMLGYTSVKWWRLSKPDHCDAINRFNCYFIMPFYNFQFTCAINPYLMNFRFLAVDVIAKAIAGVALALWVNFYKNGNLSWAITSFSRSSFNNTLVVGVALLKAMYGPIGEDLVVQSSVIQALIWFPLLLFLFEFRRARLTYSSSDHDRTTELHHCSIEIAAAKNDQEHQNRDNGSRTATEEIAAVSSSYNFGSMIKKVCVKLVKNPNCYACALGLIWALIAKRWNIELPWIVLGSIEIMGKAGAGVAMFNMGQFMALQEKVIACGVRLMMFGMVLRFLWSPLVTAVDCFVLGLRSNVLYISIIQAALPQSIASFVYAQEYTLHANVLSTAVIFGMIVSLPLLIVYYLGLDILH